MKNIYKNSKLFLLIGLFWISLSSVAQPFQPINLNTTPNTDSCTINGGTFQASVVSEALTGDGIPLNITLPGNLPQNCDINVTIEYSSPNNKIQFTSSAIGLTQTAGTLTTNTPFAGNDGVNFIAWFRFANYVTCNGEVGTFNVTFDACGQTCSTSVQVTARADNYWTVKKYFIAGNLVCGQSKWLLRVQQNNPNPSNYGSYWLNGTITETTSLPIISGAASNFSNIIGVSNKYVWLQNCQNAGTTITNTANYSFTLGDGCDTMSGTISAVSDTLQDANANINFTKRIRSTSGYPTNGTVANSGAWSNEYNITPGCKGSFRIGVYNNGNVPWTNIQIQDNLNIPGINILSVSPPNGWTTTPALLPPFNQNYTFSAPSGLVLQPGDAVYLHINFEVDSSIPVGSTLTNTAYLSYNTTGQGSGSNGSGNGNAMSCQGVNCPTLDTSIQNDTISASIHTINAISVPRISKCISNQPAGNIYQIGDTIHFKVAISNSGSGSLTTTLTDDLSLSAGQNLNIVGTPTYTYYENNPTNKWACQNFQNQQPIPAGMATNNSTLQNLNIDINNMPGICEYNRANYLIVEFDAVVMPQMYGSKTNTAYIGTQGNSANYSVDQLGILEVNKYADQEFVENGSGFNYIIEVTNSGTVPLDHITIADQMPSCVNIGQGITVKDIAGNTLTYSQSGNLNINVNPTAQLNPGETFTITVPATKQGGSQCCNASVQAKGTMTTSGIQLEANFGSSSEPAACVKSTECCDIPDFEAHLYENNGNYQVAINGGVVPIQEVNISVIDYHVEYNQRDCKPQDMGTFGILSTQMQNLSGLLLDANSNNTGSLTWLPGNPAVLNSSIDFSITKPNVLNLDCCSVDFYFCIKVQVKDVNCNVCEKVICIEKKPEPCDISIKSLKDAYCNGETINISWTGSSQSPVSVYLVPVSGGNSITLATNQPASGNISYNIPVNIDPCNQQWQIFVQSSDNKECRDLSNPFIIKCCETTCKCEGWKTNVIKYFRKLIAVPHTGGTLNSSKGKFDFVQKESSTTCGSVITLKAGYLYQFTSPQFNCAPHSCEPKYTWNIMNNATGANGSVIGKDIDLLFNNPGTYTVEIAPSCSGDRCDKCTITIHVEGNENSNNGKIGAPGSGNTPNPIKAQDWNSSRSNKTSKTS